MQSREYFFQRHIGSATGQRMGDESVQVQGPCSAIKLLRLRHGKKHKITLKILQQLVPINIKDKININLKGILGNLAGSQSTSSSNCTSSG